MRFNIAGKCCRIYFDIQSGSIYNSDIVNKQFRIILAGFFVVSIALTGCSKAEDPQQPSIEPAASNTSKPEPTAPDSSPFTPISCPEYYTEKFAGSSTQNCWLPTTPLVVTTSKPDQVSLKALDTGLNLMINAAETYAYVFYDGGIYSDVNLQTAITSEGVNNHNATVICRANDKGWYEARVSTSGYFSVYRYDTEKHLAKKNPYTNFTQDTPSTSINTGTDKTNVVQFVCKGNSLILNINGKEVFNRSVADFTEPGLVGVGGISEQNFPVDLIFGNIAIGQP
jgi:hypothetical protein